MILCKHKQTEHSNNSANYRASLKTNLAGEGITSWLDNF